MARRWLATTFWLAVALGCSAQQERGSLDLAPTGPKGDGPTDSPAYQALRAAALENLARVEMEIDHRYHLAEYRLGETEDGVERPIPEQFLLALEREYAAQPEMLLARMRALASMVFFAAPEIEPPEEGHRTPFHGLDMAQFSALIRIENQVWRHHKLENDNSKIGIRPYSVCETHYMIDEYVDAEPPQAFTDYDSYERGLARYVAEHCSEEDLAYWYNFRGLGHLRPTWIESNIMERVVRRMVDECDLPEDEIEPKWRDECHKWQQDRFGYRARVNRELSSRFLLHHPEDEDFFASVREELVLLEDENGDGVGEFLREGTARLRTGEGAAEEGAEVEIQIDSTGRFTGRMRIKEASAEDWTHVAPGVLSYETAAHPELALDSETPWWERSDFGLLELFDDPNPTDGERGCQSDKPDPNECPLLERFYTLIDRHESFYQTYTALRPDYNGRFSLSAQPSPFVACSVTLGAAHHWDDAGIPEGGRAGFIFLMKIPFASILAGSDKSISSLPEAPDVRSIQDLYAGEPLDMRSVWFDIASLSNDLFSGENEISKFGAVPHEQVEGLLVIRRPAAMGDPPPPPPADPGDGGGLDAGVPDAGGLDAGVPHWGFQDGGGGNGDGGSGGGLDGGVGDA